MKAESRWSAPDLLLSLGVHALIVGIIALVSIGHVVRDTRRPIVFSVSVVSGGSPLPQPGTPAVAEAGKTAPSGTALIENKPRSQGKARSKSAGKAQTKPAAGTGSGKGSGGMFRHEGLGANVEGAEALGYSYYLNAMLTRISDNWLNPYAGTSKVLVATVMFVIGRDGTIKDVVTEKKSGDAAYDVSCERALLVTDKLPPLPPEFPGPQLKLHLEFEQKP